MVDRPDGAELLKTARLLLNDEILPDLPKERRYQASMILRAMILAESELRAGSNLELEDRLASYAPLGTGIRAGKFDGDAVLFELLERHVSARRDSQGER